MGLTCTKVQGPEKKNVQGPKKKVSLPRFWKKLRRTRPGHKDTATMAEDINVQQESSPLDEASSDPERDDGQRESGPLDEASSDPDRDDGQRESGPLDEAPKEQERRKRKLSKRRYRIKKQKRHTWKLNTRRYRTG